MEMPYEVKIEHIFFDYAETSTWGNTPTFLPQSVTIAYTFSQGDFVSKPETLTLFDAEKVMNMSPNTMVLLIKSKIKLLGVYRPTPA